MKGVISFLSGEIVVVFWCQCILMKNVFVMNFCFYQVESGFLVLGIKGVFVQIVGRIVLSIRFIRVKGYRRKISLSGVL